MKLAGLARHNCHEPGTLNQLQACAGVETPVPVWGWRTLRTSSLRFVPVDFEARDAWWERLAASGFVSARPAVVAST